MRRPNADHENLSFRFKDTIQDRFWKYHREYPQVYRELVKYALEAKRAGRRVGIRMIWERMRWYFYVEKPEDDEFKLNDHFTSRYARLIEEQEPELKGFFELRELRAL
jgi:hypothetical protein